MAGMLTVERARSMAYLAAATGDAPIPIGVTDDALASRYFERLTTSTCRSETPTTTWRASAGCDPRQRHQRHVG